MNMAYQTLMEELEAWDAYGPYMIVLGLLVGIPVMCIYSAFLRLFRLWDHSPTWKQDVLLVGLLFLLSVACFLVLYGVYYVCRILYRLPSDAHVQVHVTIGTKDTMAILLLFVFLYLYYQVVSTPRKPERVIVLDDTKKQEREKEEEEIEKEMSLHLEKEKTPPNFQPIYLHHCGYTEYDPIELPPRIVNKLREPGCTVAQGLVILVKFMQPGIAKMLVRNGVIRSSDEPLLDDTSNSTLYYVRSAIMNKGHTQASCQVLSERVRQYSAYNPGSFNLKMIKMSHVEHDPHYQFVLSHDKESDVSHLRSYWQHEGSAIPIQYLVNLV